MANINYIIDSESDIPRVNMELESEEGGQFFIRPIEDISKFYEILSRSTLEEYLLAVENKMIEYVSSIVYDESSREALVRLNTLTNIRDNLRVYLSSPPKDIGENNG